MEKRTEKLQEAMQVAKIPGATELMYWEKNVERISVSTLDDNVDKAMCRLDHLRESDRFSDLYEQLTDDEKEVVTLGLIAIEDLRTLDEIDRYNDDPERYQAEAEIA